MHIAVIIPAFNVAPVLPDAIRSVLAQTHTDWCLIVVDDGSTDQTAAVSAGFGDPRIRLIRQRNRGVSAARNRGSAVVLNHRAIPGPDFEGCANSVGRIDPRIESMSSETTSGSPDGLPINTTVVSPAATKLLVADAEPDAVLFLDGDDWLAPHALAELAATLEAAPHAVASHGRYARVAVDGRVARSAPPPDGCLLKPLLTRNLFVNGGHVLIRRDSIEAAGGFREDLFYGEDWEFWTRLALLGEFAATRSPAPVLYVRERPGSAYLSQATDPAAYRPPIDAIHQNPAIIARLGAVQLGRLRQRADAEVAWTVGRELIRHHRNQEGRRWLVRSLCRHLTLKRLALIGLSWLRFGPFRPYQSIA